MSEAIKHVSAQIDPMLEKGYDRMRVLVKTINKNVGTSVKQISYVVGEEEQFEKNFENLRFVELDGTIPVFANDEEYIEPEYIDEDQDEDDTST